MAAARPLVSVQGLDGAAGEQTALPAVFTAPIRPDIVRTVHTNMAKNHRQPYAVSMKAGHQVRGVGGGGGGTRGGGDRARAGGGAARGRARRQAAAQARPEACRKVQQERSGLTRPTPHRPPPPDRGRVLGHRPRRVAHPPRARRRHAPRGPGCLRQHVRLRGRGHGGSGSRWGWYRARPLLQRRQGTAVAGAPCSAMQRLLLAAPRLTRAPTAPYPLPPPAPRCRGGHMFAPTKTWRRWHRKININQKRYAVASALAASAVPALVMARGHRIEQVPEVPLVISDQAQSITKTSKAVEVRAAVRGRAQEGRRGAAGLPAAAGARRCSCSARTQALQAPPGQRTPGCACAPSSSPSPPPPPAPSPLPPPQVLKAIGALPDASKARDSKALRAGKGKMRGRRYVLRKGPLVVFGSDDGISRAFRNLPGVEVASVDRLNLLQVGRGAGRGGVWGGLGACDEEVLAGWGLVRGSRQWARRRSSGAVGAGWAAIVV
jgi:ribosomal protein L4